MSTQRPSEEMARRLLEAATDIAAPCVDRLIGAARSQAEAEIHELLESAIKASLLRKCVECLEGDSVTRHTPDGAAPTTHSSSARRFTTDDDGAFSAREGSAASELPSARRSAELPAQETPSPGQPLGCYLYGITRAGPIPPMEDDGYERVSSLQTVTYQDVQAIIARVPLDEFRQGSSDSADDPHWLEARLWEHDRVAKSLLSAGPVIPCRFCTIVRDTDDVRRLLEKHYREIAATLSALDGKEEWGVKIRSDPRYATGPAGTARRRDAGTGRAYLSGKQRHARERDEVARASRALSESCHQEISAAACEAVALPLRARATDSQTEKLLFNGSYLVNDPGAFQAAVSAAAERYRPLGLLLETTGPWPPYNFIHLQLSAGPPAEVGP